MSTEGSSKQEIRQPAGLERSGRGKGKKTWVIVGLILVAVCAASMLVGATIGYMIAGRRAGGESETESSQPAAATTWTCSMHPQIKLPKPGKCPICFMDLIPLTGEEGDEGNPRRLRMSRAAMALAEIETVPVRRQYVTKPVRMVGKVDYDETRLVDITAWIPGRLDRLYVDYTGIAVRKGDHLFSMYSPELIQAQRELLLNSRGGDGKMTSPGNRFTLSNPKMAEAKLRRWGLLEEQIDEIKRRGVPSDHMTIYAPVGGIVIKKYANEGVYVDEGTRVYTIADLSRVWVYLDAYESDIPWIRFGQEVEFATESYPGEVFRGRIAFVDPVLNEKTRSVKVRLNVPNKDRRLKPGMFARAIVRSRLATGGRVFDASLAGKWISPMHPEVVKDGPGQCDVCGMDLVPAEELGLVADWEPQPPLVIPATAPLITGKRAVVYVRVPGRDEPTFEGREVLLGYRAGDYYMVRQGLEEGELVVTSGNFKIDADLQLKARPSMMSAAGSTPSINHT